MGSPFGNQGSGVGDWGSPHAVLISLLYLFFDTKKAIIPYWDDGFVIPPNFNSKPSFTILITAVNGAIRIFLHTLKEKMRQTKSLPLPG